MTSKIHMLSVKRFSSFPEYSSAIEPLLEKRRVYPFQTPQYQGIFSKHFCEPEDVYLLGIYQENTLIACGAFEKTNGTVLFLGMKKVLGGQEITDFGDILINLSFINYLSYAQGFGRAQQLSIKAIWEAIIDYFNKQGAAHLILDYVRNDSQTFYYFHTQSIENSHFTEISQEEVSPYLELPHTWEAYLESLPRIERKELRRKVKRLEEVNVEQECVEEIRRLDFETFITLHRLSDPAKNKFMTESMKNFFWDMTTTTIPGWKIQLCFLNLDGKRIAAVMSFLNDQELLLYNSGFNPDYSYYSVGLLLKAFRIKAAISEGKKVYDFLRGNERYKYDLGAKDRVLWKITISFNRQ